MTIRRTRVEWRITKATNTHSEYVLHIVFPLQQLLQELAYMLRYTLVNKSFHVWQRTLSAMLSENQTLTKKKRPREKREWNGRAWTYFSMLTTLMTSGGRDENRRVLDRKICSLHFFFFVRCSLVVACTYVKHFLHHSNWSLFPTHRKFCGKELIIL